MPGRPDTIRHKLDGLKRRCEGVGRNYGKIERTSLGTVHLAPGKMVGTIAPPHGPWFIMAGLRRD
jgi:hypothetical protein